MSVYWRTPRLSVKWYQPTALLLESHQRLSWVLGLQTQQWPPWPLSTGRRTTAHPLASEKDAVPLTLHSPKVRVTDVHSFLFFSLLYICSFSLWNDTSLNMCIHTTLIEWVKHVSLFEGQPQHAQGYFAIETLGVRDITFAAQVNRWDERKPQRTMERWLSICKPLAVVDKIYFKSLNRL